MVQMALLFLLFLPVAINLSFIHSVGKLQLGMRQMRLDMRQIRFSF